MAKVTRLKKIKFYYNVDRDLIYYTKGKKAFVLNPGNKIGYPDEYESFLVASDLTAENYFEYIGAL